ncbi:MAG: low molecular weight phosphatase family protein [Microcella sp.]|uniref:arsenate reductase/protein-tyrosine-phosphatase family protein n=1 Tax=Microcella sp. TaxID=1913979 RepID=UPI0027187E97|nr:low molecular weight phosphatase family protein [Microcella sp.]MDO8337999.1 low molecular weight phosphatase family protein [Microcella sp.]
MSDFTILTVCTGNICRSPLAEQLLRSGLGSVPGVRVRSAGSGALVGETMTEQAQALSRRFAGEGADVHLARQLSKEELRSADLVLGATREHRRAAVELLPRASRHTFTIREFARLAEALDDSDLRELTAAPSGPGDRLRLFVELAATKRGIAVPPEEPEDDDIIDPYRRSDEVYEESAAQLVPAVQSIISSAIRAVSGAPRE